MEESLKSQSGTDTAHPLDAHPPDADVLVRFSEPEVQAFDAEIRELLAALRPRVRAHEQGIRQVTGRAIDALGVITNAIRNHPGAGQTRRLVRFVAGCYNGTDYPFDLTDLRALDTRLASACLDYLDYDRLFIREIHDHLHEGERTLHQWLRDYDIRVAAHVCR
jgi:hypothetical protein